MSSVGRWLLPADLGIESVAQLKRSLMHRLRGKRPLQLDGTAVQRVHGAALQLLPAFWRERARAGRRTVLEQPSEILREALVCAGLERLTDSGPVERGDER